MQSKLIRLFAASFIGFLYGSLVCVVGTIVVGGVAITLFFADPRLIFTGSWLPISISFAGIGLFSKRFMSGWVRWIVGAIIAYIVSLYTLTIGFYYYDRSYHSVSAHVSNYFANAPAALYFLPITVPFLVVSIFLFQASFLPYWLKKCKINHI